MLNEADLRSFLTSLADRATAILALEEVEIRFAKLGERGDPRALARAHFADRPTYAVDLEPLGDWAAHFNPGMRELYCLSDDDVALVDHALVDVVGDAFAAFECVVRSADGGPFLYPHYGVWWSDYVFAGARGVYWLHVARSD